jgi:sugar O-acyltransferase (sialic acid O-acetyltransferase NeuD family)
MLIIIGAGGFGCEALWVANEMNRVSARTNGWQIVGFCDDNGDLAGSAIDGVKVLGTPDAVLGDLAAQGGYFHCAIGDNRQRRRLAELFEARGCSAATLLDPTVIIGPGVVVGTGCYVGAGTILAPHARIGRHVIINQHCTIGHDSIVEDFCQVSPGGRISGAVRLRTGASMGSNAVVMQGRTLGEHATLGAASFAVTDVPAGATAIGTPARVILRQN